MKLTLENIRHAPISMEEKFDFLHEEAEKILTKYQPCKIRHLKNGDVSCIGCGDKFTDNKINELCCGGCKFHTNKGCIAHKPLTCKLYLCDIAGLKFPDCSKLLRAIEKIAIDLHLWVFRGDKKMSLDNAKPEAIKFGYQ